MSVTESIKSVVFKSPVLTKALRAARVVLYYLRRAPHEADFHFLSDPRYANGFMLDLGANIGHSAVSTLAVQPSMRVLSIEANPACESGLKMARRLLGDRFDYRLIGVGATAGELEFHVPVRSSRMLLEEGTFELPTLDSPACVARMGRRGVDYELHTLRISLIPVDSLNLQPTVVKMDLQGLEMAALQGMRQTLERCWPTLMIEMGEHHAEVEQFLVNLGYQPCYWDGQKLRAGRDAGGLNAIFVKNHAVSA